VVKVDRESLKVLDQLGAVRTLLPSQISNKLDRRRFAVATDKDGTEVRNDDTVKEIAGEQRSGSILHIHRVYLFLQNRQQAENSGVFVVRNSAVVTVAAKGGRIVGPDLTKMNPAMQRGGPAPIGAMAPPKSYGRDRLLGKTITIRKGPYKGLLGIVKDTTDAQARIELHTKNKVITVSKDVISIKDPITGATMEGGKFSRSGAGAPFAGARPGYGGATPSRGADAWDGGRTPAFGAGAKTPAWGAFNTSSASGSRTPGWKQPAAGGRTPAPGWADGSRTSNPYADGSRTAYGGATAYGGVSIPFFFIPTFDSYSLLTTRIDINLESKLRHAFPHQLIRFLRKRRLGLPHPCRLGSLLIFTHSCTPRLRRPYTRFFRVDPRCCVLCTYSGS